VSKLRAPCEEMSKKWLPAARGALVEYLYRDEKMSQNQIAKFLGVSQSSISRYINAQRGVAREKLENIPGFSEKIREVVGDVRSGKIKDSEALCIICRYIRAVLS
jgi:predicted transcriptional regulator